MPRSRPQLETLARLILVSSIALGCGKKVEELRPQPTPSPSSPSSQEVKAPPPADPATPPGSKIEWKVPEGWTLMPDRMTRKATYEAKGAAGPAEIGVFYFGHGQGGGVEDNIARWVGQFQGLAEGAARRSEKEVGGMKRYNVDIERGTFASGMPGAPSGTKEDWGMSASIVQTPQGQYFFKMTGPATTVNEQRAHFSEMLDSVASK